MFYKCISSLGLIIALAGCNSSPPSHGDKMLRQSESTRQLGEQWNEGDKSTHKAEGLYKKGNALIDEGNSNITHGNKLISKGKKQIAKGHSLVKEADQRMHDGILLEETSEKLYLEKFPEKSEEF